MLGRKKEISYSPGRLARRLGISKPTIMAHLKQTGLIKDCFRDDNRWWRVPHSVALKICSAESLAVKIPRQKTTKKKSSKHRDDFKELFEELGVFQLDRESEMPSRRVVPRQQTTKSREEAQFELCRQIVTLCNLTPQDVLNMINEQQKAEREKAENEKDNAMDKTA